MSVWNVLIRKAIAFSTVVIITIIIIVISSNTMAKILIIFTMLNSHLAGATPSSKMFNSMRKPPHSHCHSLTGKKNHIGVQWALKPTNQTLQLTLNHNHRFHNYLCKNESEHGQGVGALYIVMDALKRRRAEEKERAERSNTHTSIM